VFSYHELKYSPLQYFLLVEAATIIVLRLIM